MSTTQLILGQAKLNVATAALLSIKIDRPRNSERDAHEHGFEISNNKLIRKDNDAPSQEPRVTV
jgi:hypothetical protein